MERFKRGSAVLIGLIAILYTSFVHAGAPMAMFHDPAITHNVWGNSSPLYRHDDHLTNLYFTPFYESVPTSKGARNKQGTKVPAGDRLGKCNMLGLFFGREAAPPDKPFNPNSVVPGSETNYPTLEAAFDALRDQTNGGTATKDYTDDTKFLGNNDSDGHYSVPIAYDKFGVRAGLQFTSSAGFGFAVKTGFTCYTQKPIYNDRTGCPFAVDCGGNEVANMTDGGDITLIKENLMDPAKRRTIATELGFKNKWDCYTTTAPEDTHVQLHWTHPIKLRDKEDSHIVDVIPYLALGAWLPTGRSKDQDILMSLPTGNDGFTGFTVEGALNFNFLDGDVSKKPMVQIGTGGGVTFFDTRDLKDYRVPSSGPDTACSFQTCFYPWKIDVRRRLGTVWNIYVTMQAPFFLDELTFYAHYVFTKQLEDSFKLCDSACDVSCGGSPERAAAFNPERLEQLSSWHSQNFHVGLNYDITENLALGAALQGGITGSRVYRITTLLLQATFSF